MSDAKVPSWINVIAGIWLIISPFVLGFGALHYATANFVVMGVVIALLSALVLWHPQDGWASWINLFLGIWLIFSPYIYGFNEMMTPTSNSIIIGVIVAAVSLWASFANRVAASGPIFRGAEPEDEERPPRL
ncbi:MAG TPA: SPW repeat protein [Oscillatoriaceae cyanobacterium]